MAGTRGLAFEIHITTMTPTHDLGSAGKCDMCGRPAKCVLKGADSGEVWSSCGIHVRHYVEKILREGWRAVVVTR